MLADGTADVLAVWKLDRWSRMGLEAIVDLTKVLDERKDALFIAQQDSVRSDIGAWRIIAAILSENARTERENIQMRVKSSINKLVEDGRYPGGNLPYGYKTAKKQDGSGRVLVLNPAEAAEIQKAAAAFLAGQSTYSIVQEMNSRGVLTRTKKRWNPQTLSKTLVSDAISGYVTHHGDLVRDKATGQPIQFWPAVLEPEVVHRIRAKMQAEKPPPGRRKRKEGARLLSGLVYCAHCESAMYPWTSMAGATSYVCTGRNKGKDCPIVTVTASRLEERVEKDFLAKWGKLQMFTLTESKSYQMEIANLEAGIYRATQNMTERGADLDKLIGQVKFYTQKKEQLEQIEVKPVVLEPTGVTFEQAWQDPEARRGIMLANIEKIVVLKGHKGKKGPLPFHRIRIYWREPQFEATVNANNFQADKAMFPEDITSRVPRVSARVLINGQFVNVEDL